MCARLSTIVFRMCVDAKVCGSLLAVKKVAGLSFCYGCWPIGVSTDSAAVQRSEAHRGPSLVLLLTVHASVYEMLLA